MSRKHLAGKLDDWFDEARAPMAELADGFTPEDLQRRGFRPYKRLLPAVAAGERGWGATGALDLRAIRDLTPLRIGNSMHDIFCKRPCGGPIASA